MPTTVTFNAGSLPPGFCPVTWQATFAGFVNALTGTINGLSATGITVSTTPPAAATAPNIWLQVTGAGVPIQLYSYNGTAGDWEPIAATMFFPGLTDTGIVNAYKVTVSPFPTAITPGGVATSGLIKGMTFVVKITTTNTGPSTFQVNAYAAGAIQFNGAALVANSMLSGGTYLLQYDGTAYQVLNVNPVTLTIQKFVTIFGSVPAAGSGTQTGLVPHGFAGTPAVVASWLCVTAGDDTYVVNDEIPLASVFVHSQSGDADTYSSAAVVVATPTTVSVIWPGPVAYGGPTYNITGKTSGTGTFTPANWQVKLVCTY